MSVYFNEFDPHAAAWLRTLAAEGLIQAGTVDERSIKEVAADDVRGPGRRHFFAGIGGWELALQLAGWPADRPVWTGSCPCQPYSTAGKRKGNADERDLWPDFFRLIRECRPQCVFGEQVEGAIGHGWLDRVCRDVEAEGYTVGACVLGAHSAGAPHIRQRLFWVATRTSGVGQADTGCQQCERRASEQRPDVLGSAERSQEGVHDQRRSGVGGLADCQSGRREQVDSLGSGGIEGSGAQGGERLGDGGGVSGMANAASRGTGATEQPGRLRRTQSCGADGGLGNPGSTGSLPAAHAGVSGAEAVGNEQRGRIRGGLAGSGGAADGVGVALGDTDGTGPQGRGVPNGERAGELAVGAAGDLGAFWADSRFIRCRDGKARRFPTQPGLFPLAHGVSGRVAVVRPAECGQAPVREEEVRYVSRVAALRGAGNAIVPQVAAEFIRAFLEVETDRAQGS